MWGLADSSISCIIGCTILAFGRTIFIQVRLAEAANGQVKINIFKVFVDLGLSSPISHPLFSHGLWEIRASRRQIRKVSSSRKERSREHRPHPLIPRRPWGQENSVRAESEGRFVCSRPIALHRSNVL